MLIGGDGNDIVIGGRGNDTALLGAGDDTFVWNPGDGSDTVEGQDGTDTLLFNGANVNEKIDHLGQRQSARRCSATSATSPWTSTASSSIDFNALGGADTITVNDLTGTDVTQVDIDLAGTPGSGTGDGAGRHRDRQRHGRRRSRSTSPAAAPRSSSPACPRR